MDEVYLKINGKTHYLWRAVDQDGNVHQPTRLREKKMRRFKSAKQTQRFLSAFGPISGHFQPRRHRLSAGEYRALLQARFQIWNEVTKTKTAA